MGNSHRGIYIVLYLIFLSFFFKISDKQILIGGTGQCFRQRRALSSAVCKPKYPNFPALLWCECNAFTPSSRCQSQNLPMKSLSIYLSYQTFVNFPGREGAKHRRSEDFLEMQGDVND